MNLLMLGGAFFSALALSLGADNRAPKPAEAAGVPVQQAAAPTAENREQPGFMTHDISVDPTTGETTETSVIGFVD